jgi:6-phosphofructokinase 1
MSSAASSVDLPRRIAVLTSGGDAPGMNAAIRAVVRAGVAHGIGMYGVHDGYSGLLAGAFVALGARDVGGIIDRGGTLLGSSRCAAMKQEAGQLAAVEQLRRAGIDALVVIGGNGSQAGAVALANRGLRVIGIASTIDNDVAGVDITIGATTAVETALGAIDRLRVTATSHHRAFLVEVMGRNCGYLALTAGLTGGAEAIVIPELETAPAEVAAAVRGAWERGKSHAIVVVAEGAHHNADALLRYFAEHAERLGFELRATRLGHIQRGGAPCAFDRLIATQLGAAAIELAATGQHGTLLGMVAGKVKAMPLHAVANNASQLDTSLLALAEMLAR